jgi:Flp pilus assembly protein TadD
MPDSPSAADTLGCAFYKMGVFDSAVTLLQEATKKASTNPTYFYHLGLASQKTNKPVLAKASFRRVLQLDPKSPHAEEIRQALAELDAAK